MHLRHPLGSSLHLQGIHPRTFEELATQAYNIELSIQSQGSKSLPFVDQRKEN